MLIRSTGELRRGVSAKDIVLADHRPHRHRRRHRLHDRVRRLGDPRAVDGRPHDRVQHGDRGRRARRPGGGGRHDDRLRQGRPFAPTGSMWDQAVAYWRTLQSTMPARRSTAWSSSTRRRSAPQVTWGTSPEMVLSIDGRVPDPDKERDAARARRSSARSVHGPEAEQADRRDRDRQGVHRLVHQLAHRGPARGRGVVRGGRIAANVKLAMVVPGSGLVKAQAEREGSTGCSRPPASNGASPAARCAWR